MATAEAEVPEVVEEHGVAAAAARLYHWSAWVHVGPGATQCEAIDEAAGKNSCTDPTHFHAWCRLPNPLQEEELREKALAEKARRMRVLRDDSTDGWAAIDGQIQQLRDDSEEASAPKIIDELLRRRRRTWEWEAQQELADERDEDAELEEEDDEYPLKWAHIYSDAARATELAGLPDDDQDADELRVLNEHIEAYEKALKARVEEKERPLREELEGLDFEGLLERARRAAIEHDVAERFRIVYNREQWIRCVLKAPANIAGGSTRVFTSVEQIENAPPEVTNALEDAFDDLEVSRNSVNLVGNS